MAILNQKEIQKKLNKGLKEIRDAVKMAKKNLIIGEVSFPSGKPEKIRKQKVKKTLEVPRADLPNLDKKPYMTPRGKVTESEV